MRRKHTTNRLRWIWLSAAVGCGTVVEDPHVDYADAKPLGIWSTATSQTRFETEGVEEEPSTAPRAGAPAIATAPVTQRPPNTMPTGTPNVAGAPAAGSAGAAAVPAAGTPKPPAGAAGAAAPSGGNETEPETTAPAETVGVTKLDLSYTTEALGGRYAPKNVGAVWVTDSSGKLVKSLEVWARIRLRYLLNYASARGSARPDVTATATLTNHKAHMASWDLKGSTGAAVPPGKYTLHAEVTDSHMDGKTITIPFDTSAGPTTIDAPASPGFKSLKLTLQ
jgi:hypothetical protein